MHVAMTGSTGFVGSHLKRSFKNKGWAVVPLGRGDLDNTEKLVDALRFAQRLLDQGFVFEHGSLEEAVRSEVSC